MTLIAAENVGLGWALAALLILIMKWGWLAGLCLIAAVIPLCGMKNPWIALVLVGSIFVGMLLLATSGALRLGVWLRDRDRAPAPVTEIRSAI
jgi:hypothetical protein